MRRAMELARRSVGMASPNPAVGCVLVRNGAAVGVGHHEYDKLDHAEVAALKDARSDARGSTAYVTLEPCCTTGRTGPCTQGLIEAGVSRVVIATTDPNPAVNGKGVAQLRAAGIEVETGVLEREAQRLNDGFARHIRTGYPFVTLKAAVSLDGRIAPAPGTAPQGAPVYLTGEEARAEVQLMRHATDAVITGINTVLQDDPRLTDRSGLPRRRPLMRVVLDSGLRIPLDAKLVRTAQEDVIIFCSIAPTQRQKALEAMGVRVERIFPAETEAGGAAGRAGRGEQAGHGGVSLKCVMERLGNHGTLNAMLEAGGQLNSAALAARLVDKLTLFYAPIFLGPGGVALLRESIAEPPIPMEHPTATCFGRDVRVETILRDPWSH